MLTFDDFALASELASKYLPPPVRCVVRDSFSIQRPVPHRTKHAPKVARYHRFAAFALDELEGDAARDIYNEHVSDIAPFDFK
ncbi:MAG TPA: hypothetical protein VEZ89_05760 [Rubrivivax sp.]|nr:hypothetical protein [Rubrivivax sp.]